MSRIEATAAETVACVFDSELRILTNDAKLVIAGEPTEIRRLVRSMAIQAAIKLQADEYRKVLQGEPEQVA